MTKATYGRRNFLGRTVPEDQFPLWQGTWQRVMVLEQEPRAYILIQKNKAERELTGNGWTFETSAPTLNDTPPPIRPHLPILPREFNQLEIKQLHIWANLSYSYSNQHTSTTRLSNNWLEAVQWAHALEDSNSLFAHYPIPGGHSLCSCWARFKKQQPQMMNLPTGKQRSSVLIVKLIN